MSLRGTHLDGGIAVGKLGVDGGARDVVLGFAKDIAAGTEGIYSLLV